MTGVFWLRPRLNQDGRQWTKTQGIKNIQEGGNGDALAQIFSQPVSNPDIYQAEVLFKHY
jgi:hypothetical protein